MTWGWDGRAVVINGFYRIFTVYLAYHFKGTGIGIEEELEGLSVGKDNAEDVSLAKSSTKVCKDGCVIISSIFRDIAVLKCKTAIFGILIQYGCFGRGFVGIVGCLVVFP